tara:strand:- start:40 stop:240 length:201 start_codon:yes stop_codon:yes gene_type:complete
MLIVAPTGTTKDATFLLTPKSCEVVFKVTGIVAALEDVEKANNIGSRIFLKNVKGLSFAKYLNSIE